MVVALPDRLDEAESSQVVADLAGPRSLDADRLQGAADRDRHSSSVRLTRCLVGGSLDDGESPRAVRDEPREGGVGVSGVAAGWRRVLFGHLEELLVARERTLQLCEATVRDGRLEDDFVRPLVRPSVADDVAIILHQLEDVRDHASVVRRVRNLAQLDHTSRNKSVRVANNTPLLAQYQQDHVAAGSCFGLPGHDGRFGHLRSFDEVAEPTI